MERVYNDWLAATARHRSKPFKIRKDFSNFEEEKALTLYKLTEFLKRNPVGSHEQYFATVYGIEDADYLPLEHFFAPSTVRLWAIQVNRHYVRFRSKEEMISETKESLIIIAEICLKEKIDFENFPCYTEEGKSIPLFLELIRTRRIFPLALYAWGGFETIYTGIPEQIRQFVIGIERDEFVKVLEFQCSDGEVAHQLSTTKNTIQSALTKHKNQKHSS